MSQQIRNIIIFLVIGAALVLVYIYFIKGPSVPEAALVTSTAGGQVVDPTVDQNSGVAKDFLTLLLSVKNIKLNDAIFSDSAFASLRDSSILITQDTPEGRPNPFAPLGADVASAPIVAGGSVPPSTTPPATPPASSTPPATTPPPAGTSPASTPPPASGTPPPTSGN